MDQFTQRFEQGRFEYQDFNNWDNYEKVDTVYTYLNVVQINH